MNSFDDSSNISSKLSKLYLYIYIFEWIWNRFLIHSRKASISCRSTTLSSIDEIISDENNHDHISFERYSFSLAVDNIIITLCCLMHRIRALLFLFEISESLFTFASHCTRHRDTHWINHIFRMSLVYRNLEIRTRIVFAQTILRHEFIHLSFVQFLKHVSLIVMSRLMNSIEFNSAKI